MRDADGRAIEAEPMMARERRPKEIRAAPPLQERRLLIVDTDIGTDIDDALALLLLLNLEDVDILGITTVYGDVELRAKIAAKIARAAGRDIPVVAGLGEPMRSREPVWHSGTEGIGVLTEEERRASLGRLGIESDAVGFLVRNILSAPGEIDLLAIGPLTNIAAAMRAEPGFSRAVRNIYFLGGGVNYPHRIPKDFREGMSYISEPSHNVECDRGAATMVFESGASISAITHDAAHQTWWDGAGARKLVDTETPEALRLVGQMMKVWLEYRSRIFGRPVTGTCPHDPIAAAEAAGRSFVDFYPGTMRVMCNSYTRFRPEQLGPHRASIGIDGKGFTEWFEAALFREPFTAGSRES